MSKKEQRVVNAFINCVKSSEFSYDYAVTLINNTEAYGYLTEEAKEVFYKEFETPIEETENVESEVIPNESELESEI